MAKMKKDVLRGLCRLLFLGARKGVLPSGLVFGLLGFLASGLSAEDIAPTCYVPMPSYYGPGITSLIVFPNPTEGARTVRVVATVITYSPEPGDTHRVARAELCARTESFEEIPGFTQKSMKPSDGSFDSDSEDVYLDLDVSGWPYGNYWIYVVGYDESGMTNPSDSERLTITSGK
ncbi:MAG: hypothetical protein ABIM74_01240 [candidate division WOR-3 bacterium]